MGESVVSIELNWKPVSNYREVVLGSNVDGVRFTLTYHPTCYRRGPWRLLIVVLEGPNHHAWGCFDDADQPLRYYHDEECALREANKIANVLWTDRVATEKPILPNEENPPGFVVADWVFERQSGYSGFRHKLTAEWIYATEFERRKAKASVV